MVKKMIQELSDSGIHRSTLEALDNIKKDIHNINKKMEKIENKQDTLSSRFERLSGQLDVSLPKFVTSDFVKAKLAEHANDCTKRNSLISSPPGKKSDPKIPAIFVPIKPSTMAKWSAAITAIAGAIYALVELLTK